MDESCPCCSLDPPHVDHAIQSRNIFLEACREQLIVLHHDANAPPPVRQAKVAQRLPIYPNGSRGRLQQAQDDLGQCRLAASGRANDGYMFPCMQLQVDILQHPWTAFGVPEAHLVQMDFRRCPASGVELLR